MRLYRSISLGLLLLLALQVCSSAEAAPTGSSTMQRTHLPGSFPDIPGLDAEALYNSNPIDAVAAYKDCQEHAAACKTPCSSISNCAGCYPGSDGSSTVCGFCLPGHYMSADQKSCLPCKESTFSTGGRAASCTLCPDGQTSKAGAARCSGGKQTPAQQGPSNRQSEDSCANLGLNTLGSYGCVADVMNLPSSGLLAPATQRCAVRVTENPVHYDACSKSPTYPGASSTKCTQLSIATAPITDRCSGQNNCTGSKSCWVQAWPRDSSGFPYSHPGWTQSGPDCDTDPYGYLAPCPYSKCRTAPSSAECKVGNTFLTMREAPCFTAPAVERRGEEVVIPPGNTFEYLDRNSRQSGACASYGFKVDPNQTHVYCWVLGDYQGLTGWVPVQRLAKNPSGEAWTSALCTYYGYDLGTPELLVSDDGSATGCAELTKDFTDGCFPANAEVTLHSGGKVHMSHLNLGDEVAVRSADGSVTWSVVYAFGHRDDSAPSEFVEITSTTESATSSIQATSDHFVLVGSDRPTYKRAGQVVVGDTVWMSVAGAPKLVPAFVIRTQIVSNTGLYAPMTLSGSIIVNNIAASVHSTWFADRFWSLLGLPEAWLHTLYQAALAPVRLLWHVLPSYQQLYAKVEQHYGIAATVPNLTEFVAILAWVLRDVAAHSGFLMATTATMALAASFAVSAKKGQSVRTTKTIINAAALVLLMCLSLAAIATASRTEGPTDESQVWTAQDEPAAYKGYRGATRHGRHYRQGSSYTKTHKEDTPYLKDYKGDTSYGRNNKDVNYHKEDFSHGEEYKGDTGYGKYKGEAPYKTGYKRDKAYDNKHKEDAPYEQDYQRDTSYDKEKTHHEEYYKGDTSYGEEHKGKAPYKAQKGEAPYDADYKPNTDYNEDRKGYGVEHYKRHPSCGPIKGCCTPPDVHLPHGHWACSDDTVPVGGKCTGVCDGSGFAEATCTPYGWRHVGACYKLAVCADLPTAPVAGGFWPEGCRNALVGDFCISKCNNPADCSTLQQAIVRCTPQGWQQTPSTAINLQNEPGNGVPIACGVETCLGSPTIDGVLVLRDCPETAVGDSCTTVACRDADGNYELGAASCLPGGVWGPCVPV